MDIKVVFSYTQNKAMVSELFLKVDTLGHRVRAVQLGNFNVAEDIIFARVMEFREVN